jgi:hypothetical protein
MSLNLDDPTGGDAMTDGLVISSRVRVVHRRGDLILMDYEGPNLRTDIGFDLLAMLLGNTSGDKGTSTGTTATSLTDSGKAWTTDQWKGKLVAVAGTVVGVIKSNTATALTVDEWHDAASFGGAAGSTPGATSAYQILPGGAPAAYIAVSNDATSPAAGDTTLAGELSASGFSRAVATYAHTLGTKTFTLTYTFTATGAVSNIQKAALLQGLTGSIMANENTFTSTGAAIQAADALAVTWTMTLS